MTLICLSPVQKYLGEREGLAPRSGPAHHSGDFLT